MSYAMALDNSWDILSEEEMYDVNGGRIPTFAISASIDIVLLATGKYFAFAGVKRIGKFFGQTLAKKVSSGIATIVGRAISLFVNVCIGTLGNSISRLFWSFTSLGNLVGSAIDLLDGKLDGWIG